MEIFISYDARSRDQVEILKRDLVFLKHSVRLSVDEHETWDEEIRDINRCDLFIFALTRNALTSDFCRRECNYADALDKQILPIILSNVDVMAIPVVLRRLQFVDYRRRTTKACLTLIRALTSLPEANPLPDPLPIPPEAPLSKTQRPSNLLSDLSSSAFWRFITILIVLGALSVFSDNAPGILGAALIAFGATFAIEFPQVGSPLWRVGIAVVVSTIAALLGAELLHGAENTIFGTFLVGLFYVLGLSYAVWKSPSILSRWFGGFCGGMIGWTISLSVEAFAQGYNLYGFVSPQFSTYFVFTISSVTLMFFPELYRVFVKRS